MKKKSKSRIDKDKWKQLSELLRSARELSGCEICGKTTNLQCHHICGKYYRKSIMRWDPSNILICCPKHHFEFHRNPVSTMRWFQKHREYDYLKIVQILGDI